MATTTVKQRDLERRLNDSTFAKRFFSSSSPGAVAVQLNIGRHGVYQLLKRGRLDSIRLVSDRPPRRLLALLIPSESVSRYLEGRYQRESA